MTKRDFRLGDIMLKEGGITELDGKDMVIIEYQFHEHGYTDYEPIKLTEKMLEDIGFDWEYDNDTATIRHWRFKECYVTEHSGGFSPNMLHKIQDECELDIEKAESLFEN